MTSVIRTGLAILFSAIIGTSSVLAGSKDFNERSIEGRWGFSGDGLLAGANPEDRVPIAGIGVVTFDGDGGCEITGSNNLNGEIIPVNSEACTYTVNPDGTGLSTAIFPALGPLPPAEIPVAFVIVDGCRELRFMQQAVIASHFVAKRIDEGRGRCRR